MQVPVLYCQPTITSTVRVIPVPTLGGERGLALRSDKLEELGIDTVPLQVMKKAGVSFFLLFGLLLLLLYHHRLL